MAYDAGFIRRARRRVIANMALWLLAAGVAGAPAAAEWRLRQEQTTVAPAFRLTVKAVLGERELRLHIVWPDAQRTRLTVVDNPGNALGLDELMGANGCLAGVNGGYFHPDATPLGWVVSAGREIHPFEQHRLLSGLLTVRGGQVALSRPAEFKLTTALSDALQAGPFLIDRGRPTPGLDPRKPARRTVVLIDRAGRYGLAATTTPLTLAELAEALATPGVVHELRLARALNLDGGSSTGLWARLPDDVLYLPEVNSPRTVLCLRLR